MLYETLSNLAAIGVATNLAWKISHSSRRWFGLSWLENAINKKLDDFETKVILEEILSESDYSPALTEVKKIKSFCEKLKKIEIKLTGVSVIPPNLDEVSSRKFYRYAT